MVFGFVDGFIDVLSMVFGFVDGFIDVLSMVFALVFALIKCALYATIIYDNIRFVYALFFHFN